MKRKLERLRNGKFNFQPLPLSVSKTKIRVTTEAEQNQQGDLTIEALTGGKVTGYVISSHRRFVPAVTRFSGTIVKLSYGIDVQGLIPGASFRGSLTLLTNFGEHKIPFEVTVQKQPAGIKSAQLRNLDDFTTQARRDIRGAFRIFKEDSFIELLEEEPELYTTLCLGMKQNPLTYQNMEEFLIGAGKKKPVELTLEAQTAEFYDMKESLREELQIHKSGWGYLSLEIEVQGAFLEVNKHMVFDEDFVGSVFNLSYMIHIEQLKKGKNFGRILCKGAYQTLVFTVTASVGSKVHVDVVLAEKHTRVFLERGYLDCLTGHRELAVWKEEAFSRLRQLSNEGLDSPFYQLCRAFFLLMLHRELHGEEQEAVSEELTESRRIVKRYQAKAVHKGNRMVFAFALYLQVLLGEETRKDVAYMKLERCYLEERSNFFLLWLVIKLANELGLHSQETFESLKQHFYQGGCSPFLYYESFRLCQEKLHLLTTLRRFELQMFYFAVRQGLLTPEIKTKFLYLAGMHKTYEPILYKTLALMYKAAPQDEILEVVTKQVILGAQHTEEGFSWLSLAVAQEIKLTRLNECFVAYYRGDPRALLPTKLYLYFTYNNTLNDTDKAFIYANIIANKEKIPQVYNTYKEQIQEFAREKLRQEWVDENYAMIYQDVFREEITTQEAQLLSKHLFSVCVYCEDPKICDVVVVHGPLKEQEIFQLKDRQAIVRLYSEDALILFRDEKQNRYESTVEYTLQKLFAVSETKKLCEQTDVTYSSGYLLSEIADSFDTMKVDEADVPVYKKIMQSEDFTEEFKHKVKKIFLAFLAGIDVDIAFAHCAGLDLAVLAQADKIAVLELLIQKGEIDLAFHLIKEVGCEGVATLALLKLTSRLIEKSDFEEDEELVMLSYQIFVEGKYDETILQYLVNEYLGPVSTMFTLWEKASRFSLDTYVLEERILLMAMFTDNYDRRGSRLLVLYTQERGREAIILSYLSFASYGYFIHHCSVGEFVFECLEEMYEQDILTVLTSRLALFRWLVYKKERTIYQERILEELLEECHNAGLEFAFFSKIDSSLLSRYQLDDKVFIEYTAHPRASVRISYHIEDTEATSPGIQEKTEALSNIYDGVYLKKFTLFYGEVLHYKFIIQYDGVTKETADKTFSRSRKESGSDSKFQKLNQLKALLHRSDWAEFGQKLLEYRRQEQFVNKLFVIEKD
ncbi:MAG: DUF5717 family protein [Lachnospiraceae bacterium]